MLLQVKMSAVKRFDSFLIITVQVDFCNILHVHITQILTQTTCKHFCLFNQKMLIGYAILNKLQSKQNKSQAFGSAFHILGQNIWRFLISVQVSSMTVPVYLGFKFTEEEFLKIWVEEDRGAKCRGWTYKSELIKWLSGLSIHFQQYVLWCQHSPPV